MPPGSAATVSAAGRVGVALTDAGVIVSQLAPDSVTAAVAKLKVPPPAFTTRTVPRAAAPLCAVSKFRRGLSRLSCGGKERPTLNETCTVKLAGFASGTWI